MLMNKVFSLSICLFLLMVAVMPAVANDCVDGIVDTYHAPRADVTMDNDNALFNANEPVIVPLNIELANRLGVAEEIELDAPMGVVSIYKNGRILYDGRDITSRIERTCTNGTTTSITEE